MKKINVDFIDCNSSMLFARDMVLECLKRRYEVNITDKPDFVFDFGLGHRFVKAEGVKILLNGENSHPDFNFFDYAMGSDDIVFGDRYCRVPHFVLYPEFATMKDKTELSDEALLNRGFCSFVVSRATGHHGDPMREYFFHELSKYKQVASGGRWMNNVGGPIANKLDFCRGYKFHIAFENSSSLGYTTEKLMQAFAADTVPIYYGNEDVGKDFNTDAFIHVKSKKDVKEAIERIVDLDKNDEKYLKMCRASRLVKSPEWYLKEFEDFLYSIFDREPEDAARLCPYGHIANHRKHIRKLYEYMEMIKAPERWMRNVRNFIIPKKVKAKTRA